MIVAVGPIAPGRHIPPVAVVDLAQADIGPRKSRGEAPTRDTDVDPAQAELPDDYVLVGPRPAFEINVLERERTVHDVLARLELERSRSDTTAFLSEAGPGAATGQPDGSGGEPPGSPPATGDEDRTAHARATGSAPAPLLGANPPDEPAGAPPPIMPAGAGAPGTAAAAPVSEARLAFDGSESADPLPAPPPAVAERAPATGQDGTAQTG